MTYMSIHELAHYRLILWITAGMIMGDKRIL